MNATSRTRIVRFDRVERALHWCNATLFFVLIFTGASLYFAPLSTTIAHRELLKTLHVYTGLALPVPVILALIIPAGRRLRADLHAVNRWTDDDWRWWSRRTRASARLGKFNPGQKLNVVFVGATIVVMLMTGVIMRYTNDLSYVSDSWRTGATFVHDWTFIAVVVVVIGHITIATRDPDALRSMVRGDVPDDWARRERPRWWASVRAGSDVEAGLHERVDEPAGRAGEMAVGDAVHGGARDGVRDLEL